MAIASIIDSISAAYASIAKKPLSSFCFLESTHGDDVLVGSDGSLATMVRIDGSRQMLGDKELNKLVADMSLRLSSYLGESGHAIQFWFCRDPDASPGLVKRLISPARTVAHSLGLELDDLLDEREKHLSNYIVSEQVYLVLWTRPSVLGKEELANVRKTMKAPPLWPVAIDTQNIFVAARQIATRHHGFVSSLIADLENLEIRADACEVHDALNVIRGSIYPDMLGSQWRPTLYGDPTAFRGPEVSSVDNSHFLPPRIEDQLFDREAERLSPRVARIGRHAFAGLDMSIGPQEPKPFDELINRIRKINEFPWRVSFLIEGNAISGAVQLTNFLAAIVGFSNSDNKQIREAIKGIQERAREGEVCARLRVSFCTWGPADQTALVEERASQLQRAIETWGYCGVTSITGDPVQGALSSAVGLDVASTAPPGAMPLRDLVSMMPWARDASPWPDGSVLFRTEDKRPFPFQPGSSQQSTFIDLISAPPGYAKSVFLNTTNLALCLSPAGTVGAGGAKLPRIAILDIGPSSSGLISLIKEALPHDRWHEAQYRRLRMVKEHAINPFDTQLGMRRPLPNERAFLVNFLTLLGTAAGETEAPANLADLAGQVVDEIYQLFDDTAKKSSPRPYTPGEDDEVDKFLQHHDIDLPLDATWWDAVDRLFAAGDTHGAYLAQRHAVPRLEDLQTVVRKPTIVDVFGENKTQKGEPLIAMFQQMISTALREYPILTCPTRFDIGDSRVVSLDLDEAAPRGGGPADKQTALVYMLGRFILARDFYMNEELIDKFPEQYRPYQEKRIRRIRESPKRIVYDEFHRTRSSSAVREQVLIDMREGRKWGVHIALASQLLGDFDKDMVDVATGIWIMGVGTERAADEAASMFGLSETAQMVVKRRLNGPTKDGAPFLGILNMKDGRHEHMLWNTLGPMELWAFSTTAEDAALRNRLYKMIGPQEARRRLARKFPGGSAKKEIEKRTARLAETGQSKHGEGDEGIIDELVKELVDMA